MESYLYVVLYCGLVRLPHSLNFVETKATIDEMLDKRRLVDDQSKLIGGTGKLSNMRRRLFTGVIIWEAPAMQTWIDTMCDYLSPMRDAPPDRIHKWTAPDLDQFWSTLLNFRVYGCAGPGVAVCGRASTIRRHGHSYLPVMDIVLYTASHHLY
ncbi:hypothetical protein C2E23DRAFT_362285 [Lenzites betulinus]|nr:hypothetical protein C2E23DRAFT_362285 [Lenzites betulinus]